MAKSEAVTSNEEATHSSGVFVALVPWVLFTVIAEHGTLKLASIAALE